MSAADPPADAPLEDPLEDVADTPARALTLDEAVTFAILLQKNGDLREAGELYRRVLDAEPEHARALHYAGVLAHQQGRSDEAISLIGKSLALIETNLALDEKSLALAPDLADGYNNLGIVLQSSGHLGEAVDAYHRAIAIDPRHANARSNLGVLLRAAGKPAEAEAEYRAAIAIAPDHIDAHTNLGILLNALGRTDEAAACYCKVITLRPKHREARRLLALAHCLLGEVGEAIRIFETWLSEEPDDPIARHMLAACSGHDVPARASDGYVERTFDGFAASFESKLQRLSYRAPALVAAVLETSGLAGSQSLDVLDAGCGTGLCGPLIAPYAARLTGIDLSEGMLAHARQKHIYDELTKAELTAYLHDHRDAFDLIVSADTLVYFGSLDAVAAAAAGALRPNGRFVFTLERANGTEPDAGYRLEQHGRYSHSRAYVERLLTGAGLAPEITGGDLRMESGAPVAGLVVVAAKPRSAV
jgi:predicted TPR repeat methyltransferase